MASQTISKWIVCFNSFLSLISKKTSNQEPHYGTFTLWEESNDWWKEPATRKAFPDHDVIPMARGWNGLWCICRYAFANNAVCTSSIKSYTTWLVFMETNYINPKPCLLPPDIKSEGWAWTIAARSLSISHSDQLANITLTEWSATAYCLIWSVDLSLPNGRQRGPHVQGWRCRGLSEKPSWKTHLSCDMSLNIIWKKILHESYNSRILADHQLLQAKFRCHQQQDISNHKTDSNLTEFSAYLLGVLLLIRGGHLLRGNE